MDGATPPLLLLPPPLLSHVAVLCFERDGVLALAALSCTCRALLAACSTALAAQTHVARPATTALRRSVHPAPHCAARCMRRLLGGLSGVVALDLGGLHGFMFDEGLAVIGRSCLRLESLKLDHCPNITGAGLDALAAPGAMSRLRHLSLASCGDIGSGGFLAWLPALRSLNAAYCRSLADAELLAAAGGLEDLDLTGCEGVGDALCGALPAVRRLGVAFVPKVSDAGLERLGASSPLLRTLSLARRSHNLWDVGLYTEAGVARLQRQVPGLEVEYVM